MIKLFLTENQTEGLINILQTTKEYWKKQKVTCNVLNNLITSIKEQIEHNKEQKQFIEKEQQFIEEFVKNNYN